ncbi:MAG TPA: hypothetical protein VGQ57_20145 [Polyangiaceae bacterium]|nr:hypothetical protein [Polyangiaceae bacterium]
MSDLRRWSEEDASAEELALLEVARRRRALPSQRAAVLSALGVGVATTAAGAAGAAGLTTKLIGLALLASAGAGAVFFLHAGPEKSPHSAPAANASVAPAVTSTEEPAARDATVEPARSELEPAPEAHESPAKIVVRPKAAPTPSSSATAASSLSRELQVLKQAHDALAKGNPNGALAALDDYHHRFPQGALGAEETVIRVQALLARGDRAQAAALARQFSAAHPDSLYARRVETLVSGVH